MSTLTKTAGKAVEILLAEDNRTDAILIKEVLKHCRLAVRLGLVDDGEQALAYLRHQGKFSDAPDPDLVLLDLMLPKLSGLEVLMEMKRDFLLNHIPVVMVTSSHNVTDAKQAYQMNAESYIVKPPHMFEFPILIKTIERIFADWAHQPW
jgi:two-component system, chemotaxis family, response regulator Rcp1